MAPGSCLACGQRNPAGTRWCSSCGSPMGAQLEPTVEHSALFDRRGVASVDRSAFSRDEGLFVVNHGPKAGARYALDTDLVALGRDPGSDIFLDDVTVSARHAEVRRNGALYSIRDLGSLNGTYVNRRLVEEGQLSEGDEVQIGRFKLVFVRGTSS